MDSLAAVAHAPRAIIGTRVQWYIALPFTSTTSAGSYEACPTSASKRHSRFDNGLLILIYLDIGSTGRYSSWGVCCGRHGCAQSSGNGPAEQQGPRPQSIIPSRSCYVG